MTPAPRRRALLLPLAATALVTAVALYLADPAGAGGMAFVAVCVVGLTGLVLGPTLRRAEPRGAWRWMAGAGVAFLAGLALRIGVLPEGGSPLQSADLWTIIGYLATLRGLAALLRAVAGASQRLGLIDATIVTSGAGLGFFSAEVGPHLTPEGAGNIGASLLTVVYPVLDAGLVAFGVHLALRTSRRTPSLVLLLAGVSTWLVADVGYVVVWHVAPGTTNQYLNALFMVTYATTGLAACHRSVRRLASPATGEQHRERQGRPWILLTLLLPVGAAITLPASGWLDAAIRVVLLSAAVVSVSWRMRHTLTALTDAVTALEDAEREALHRALHDPLTGLPNRVAFLAAVRDRLAAGGGTSVLLLDSDRFTLVNDTWGHPVGDELLVGLARRLRERARPGDEVFRLGGDEFAVLAAGGTPQVAGSVAERLLEVAAEPVVLTGGQRITMTASVGVAQAGPGAGADGPDPGAADADTLVRDADTALHTAKDSGRATWVLFDASLRATVETRVRLAEQLRDAVAEGQVGPHYQAIVTTDGQGVFGFEALARWTHPETGPVSPGDFIPVAEDTGLIVDIGEVMLRRACVQLAQWRHATGRDLHVSVNVSAVQFARADVPALVAEVLAETGLPPHALWLEITESLLVTEADAARTALERLHALGVVLCIDDFGTGYSSLSYLTDLPVDVVKVDRAFVQALTRDERAAGVVRAVVEMARALRLTGVVAEGVELPAEAELLHAMGCAWGQGFLWARPLPPDAVATQLLGLAPAGAAKGTPAPAAPS